MPHVTFQADELDFELWLLPLRGERQRHWKPMAAPDAPRLADGIADAGLVARICEPAAGHGAHDTRGLPTKRIVGRHRVRLRKPGSRNRKRPDGRFLPLQDRRRAYCNRRQAIPADQPRLSKPA